MDGWEKGIVFKNGHTGSITDLAWSSNGAYLASSGTDGKVHIWQTKDQTILTTYIPSFPTLQIDTPHSMSWH
jgi:chromosome transmission fidelity protein 4